MQELFGRIRRLGAAWRAPCLVEGPPGSGKELVVRAIHQHSPLGGSPLLAVNCAAFSEHLLESEFFGHEKGAFSGAIGDKRGLVEIAKGGALFLDEVGELPVPSQPKFLRYLANGEFLRVGGLATHCSNARILSATNRPLADLVRLGSFREDLYYRLRVLPLWVPPLKERLEDLELLVGKFLSEAALECGRPVPIVLPEAMKLFHAYSWPGNIRELENLIRSLAALVEGDSIGISELRRERFLPALDRAAESKSYEESDIDRTRQGTELALKKHPKNLMAAARELGIAPSTLYRRMKRFGLKNRAGGRSL